MDWEERLLAVFDDLEQQAEGLVLAERDTAARELGRAAYAEVLLADRVHASVGRRLTIELAGSPTVAGRLVRAGEGWCLLEDDAVAWVVRLDAVTAVTGLSEQALGADYRPLTSRLGLGSVLRGLAEGLSESRVLAAGGQHTGRVRRVGADFLELLPGAGGTGSPLLMPFAHVAAVQVRVG